MNVLVREPTALLSEGLGDEDQCLTKGHKRIDLVLNPGPPSYKTTVLPLSHRSCIQCFRNWSCFEMLCFILTLRGVQGEKRK